MLGRTRPDAHPLMNRDRREQASENRKKLFHRLFDVGIVLKGIDGLLEMVGGLLLLLVTKPELNALVFFLTERELSEDPHDVIAQALRHAAASLSSDTKLFASVYLLVHGFIKLFLVAGLLRSKLWSYPAALIVLSLFIAYQCYRLSGHYSLVLLALIVLDIAIVFLIWYEYAAVRKRTA